jgi:hypothetical protein
MLATARGTDGSRNKMKPLTNQRRKTPAASSAQSSHRASPPHAEIGKKICNLLKIIFGGACMPRCDTLKE